MGEENYAVVNDCLECAFGENSNSDIREKIECLFAIQSAVSFELEEAFNLLLNEEAEEEITHKEAVKRFFTRFLEDLDDEDVDAIVNDFDE